MVPLEQLCSDAADQSDRASRPVERKQEFHHVASAKLVPYDILSGGSGSNQLPPRHIERHRATPVDKGAEAAARPPREELARRANAPYDVGLSSMAARFHHEIRI